MIRTLAITIALAIISTCASVQATIVLQLSDETLARDADLIVHGRVVRKDAGWNTKKTRIYTTYAIQPIAIVKSPSGQSRTVRAFEVRVLGGTVGKYGMRVAGTTRMQLGEEVLLYLERVRGHWMVLGMSQGKLEIFRHQKTNERWVRARRTGLTLATRNKDGRLTYTHPAPVPDRPLRNVLDQIRNHLKAKR